MAYKAPLMHIAGKWTQGSAPEGEVRNPADNSVLSGLARADQSDLDRALASAQRGFEHWRGISAEKRCELILAGVALLRERADAIAQIITLEQGKPVGEARTEVLRAAAIIEWDANEGRRAYGTVVPGEPGFMRYGLRLPIGPVAAFTPWNFPISSPARKIGGAIAAGCSVVVKASEETPGSAAALVECLIDGGVPGDVINLVFGDSRMISSYLIASPVIRAITFTGSTPVGKHLARLAADHAKPAVMELGGHAPVIISADADIEAVVREGVGAKFRNAGQICVCPTRFIVERPIYADFVDAYGAAVSKLNVGNGLESGVQMGPLANKRRLDAISEMVEDAVRRGGRVVTGGERIGNAGYFHQPTVLADLPADAMVLNEEPFGPLAPVMAFDTFEEAITIANSLPFGLASYAFTTSQQRAHELAMRVESGIMSINHFGSSTPDTPFGGVKESGYGREGGYETLDAFMVTKFISHRVAG